MKKMLFAAALGLALCSALPAETVLERPEIIIGFDDDASSLLITAGWKDKNGEDKRETFNLGKDLHVVFEKKGSEWVKSDEEFTSDPIPLEANESLIIEYGKWQGNGTSMPIGIDTTKHTHATTSAARLRWTWNFWMTNCVTTSIRDTTDVMAAMSTMTKNANDTT